MISAQSVRDLFDKSGIKNVAIIDDVFDPPGTNLSATDIENIFNDLDAVPLVKRKLQLEGCTIKEPADLTEKALLAIKRIAATDAEAQDVWDKIAAISEGKKAGVEKLASNLKKSLKLTVKKIPAASARKRSNVVPDDSNVIFLDYELEAGKGGGDLSSSIVEKIYAQFKGKPSAPLLILMSSLELTEADIAKFQKRSDFLSGMFYFVPKNDLYEVEKLHYRLAAFAKALPTGQVLQKFIEHLDTSLHAAKTTVFNDLRSLNIADYAFLQTLRLHEDGQPMGDYLMWLISAHLVKELGGIKAMKAVERAVSDLSFDDLPPTSAKPSPSLGALYSSAVMRPMDPLPDPKTDPMDYLQFGDLFRKGTSKNVLACITPPCDLAFGPTRPIASDRSILFLTGKLFPIEKPLKPFEQRQPRTELVKLDTTMYRIVWDTKGLIQLTWGGLREKLDELKFKRVARLNTPFALEVQRSFATDLTRIGMPVSPPLYNPIRVELICTDTAGNDHVLTSEKTSMAHLSGSERGEKIVLGSDFMDGLPAMLAKADELLADRHAALEAEAARIGAGRAVDVDNARKKIVAARQDAGALSAMRGPFALDPDNLPKEELGGLFEVHQGAAAPIAKDWIPLRLRLLREQDQA